MSDKIKSSDIFDWEMCRKIYDDSLLLAILFYVRIKVKSIFE
jgi:hypothetical protein